MSYYDQQQAPSQAYPPPANAYPPPGQAYPPAYAAPPPASYPMKEGEKIPNQLLHRLRTVAMASGKDAVLPCAAAAFLICASKA
ncbi:huntingtin-like isoform X2 [Phoenix dactylifera]|uniref:Huntingtin-like isoform X2 n=1 Tax=Phoenix dactylifera TaxID=42345 RepID=A0A8B9AP73_PHODC|nr:huntingtin-like isoform X2 [Phoenix dactylifera]